LDEIEKAHPDVFNVLLQVLDDGQLTDNKGRTANFKNTIIIMTSNIGSEIIQASFETLETGNKEEILGKTKEVVFEQLKNSVRPEFLNRIDEVIMFEPLSQKHVQAITKLHLAKVEATLAEQNINLSVTPQAMKALSSAGFDPQFGARPIKRVIQKQVLNLLSKQILLKEVVPNSHIVLDSFDGKLVFREPLKKEAQAEKEVLVK